MKRYIQAAEFKKYNANTRGSNTPDCVKRSLSLAFNTSYTSISNELNATMKSLRKSQWNVPSVFESVILAHGGSAEQSVPEPITVNDFLDTVASSGTYIIECNKTPAKIAHGAHLTCAIDDDVFDSWDCRDWYVCGYYTVNSASHEFSDILSYMGELAKLAYDSVMAAANKQIQKYNLTNSSFILGDNPVIDGYTISVLASFKYYDTDHMYNFKVPYVFSPTMSLEDAKRKVKEITNVRIYDRFYSINKSIQDEVEAQELHAASGHDNRHLYLTPREANFYKTLPAWVQRFVKELYVDNPGQNYDSYELITFPLPGDSNREDVKFYGYDAATIREELKRYKSNYARVDIDYYFDEL